MQKWSSMVYRNLIKGLVAASLFLLTAFICLNSCKKDDTGKDMELIQDQDWEQLSGMIGDSVYAALNIFHKVSFSNDGSFEMLIDWEGGYSFPDTMVLTPLHGKYKYDADQGKIIFPEIIDSVLFSFGGGTPEIYYRYFTPWKILQINDTMLFIQTEMTYNPPKGPAIIWFPGYRLHFRSIETERLK